MFIIITRAVHIDASLILVSSFAFEMLIVTPVSVFYVSAGNISRNREARRKSDPADSLTRFRNWPLRT